MKGLNIIFWIALILYGLYPNLYSIPGKGYGLQIIRSSPQIEEAYPGDIQKFTFQISNRSDEDVTFLPKIFLPRDWTVITPQPFPIRLHRFQTYTLIVAIRISNNSPPSDYPLTLDVQSPEHPGLVDTQDFTIRVLPRENLLLKAHPPKARLDHDGGYHIQLELSNKGNKSAPVDVMAIKPDSYQCIISPSSLNMIRPGETEFLTCSVFPKDGPFENETHQLEFLAKSLGNPPCVCKESVVLSIHPDETLLLTSEKDEGKTLEAEVDVNSITGGSNYYQVLIKRKSSDKVEAVPGTVQSATFLISNNSDKEVEFTPQIDIPEGWSVITPHSGPIKIGPNKRKVQIVSVKIPPNALAGTYPINFSTNKDLNSSGSFTLEVLPKAEIRFSVKDAPKRVFEGKPYQFELEITNTGNTPKSVELSTKERMGYSCIIEPSNLSEILPGESEVVYCKVKTEKGLQTKQVHQVEVFAEGLDDPPCECRESVSVDIFPSPDQHFDPYIYLPSFLTFGIGKDENGYEPYFQVSGEGTIDEKGEKFFSYFAKFSTPSDYITRTLTGQMDEMNLHYRDPGQDIFLGDGTYSLSPGTVFHRYGRGASYQKKVGCFELGGMFIESKVLRQKDYGGFLAYSPSINCRYTFITAVNEIREPKVIRDLDGVQGTTYSFLTQLKQFPIEKLELEYGVTDSLPFQSSQHESYHTIGRWNPFNEFWFDFEGYYAGSKYRGYYNDIADLNFNVLTPICGKLRGNFSFHSHRGNLDLNPEKKKAPLNWHTQAKLTYPFENKLTTSLSYNNGVYKDLLDYEAYRLETIGFFLQKTFEKFSFLANINTNFKKELSGLHRRHSTFLDSSFYTYFEPIENMQCSAFAQLYYGANYEKIELNHSYGASADWRIKERSHLKLYYQYFSDNKDKQLHQLRGDFSHLLKNKHEISFSGIAEKGKEKTRHTLLISYTIPFESKIGRKESIAGVNGKILDHRQQPVPNTIVCCDQLQTMTDEKGEFCFANLKPGDHHFWVDEEQNGLLMDKGAPSNLKLDKGKMTSLNLKMKEQAKISGKIQLYGFVNEKGERCGTLATQCSLEDKTVKNLEVVGSWSKAKIILTSKDKRIERTTTPNAAGEFLFSSLPSGMYELKILANNLPLHHFLEKDLHYLEVTSGGEEQVMINIYPKLRKFKMIDGGEVKAQATRPPV